MNHILQQFARETILDGLRQLPAGWQSIFKRMYGCAPNRRGDPTRTPEEIDALPIDQVVSEVPPDKLDWAMQQVERSVQKLTAKEEAT